MPNIKATISTPPIRRRITIEMDETEAQSLRAICQHIGGDQHKSRRRHFVHINRALIEAGISFPKDTDIGIDDTGRSSSIYFKDVDDSCL